MADLLQKGVHPFGECLVLDVKSFLLKGFNAAQLELIAVLALSHWLISSLA